MNDSDQQRKFDEIALYCLGRCEQFIEDYAKSTQIPAGELTQQVAVLLLTSSSGQTLGTQDRVSRVPRQTARKRQALEPLAVDDPPHSHQAPLTHVRASRRARAFTRRSTKGSKFNGTHWTQQKKNKAKLQRVPHTARRAKTHR